MERFVLSEVTKNNISKMVGVPYDDLRNVTPEEEVKIVSNNGQVAFSKERDFRKIGRGNPLLARRKIRTLGDLENHTWAKIDK